MTELAVNKKRARAVAISKLVLGLTLIASLLRTVDIGSLVEQYYAIDLRYLILVFLLPHIGILLSTLKWQILLRVLEVRVGLHRLFGMYMIGTFFSNFLPTMIGGDAVRSYTLYREGGDASSVLAATFLERFIGLLALLTLLPLILFQPLVQERFPMVGWLVAAILVSFAVIIALITTRIFDIFRGWHPRRELLRRILDFIKKTHSKFRSYAGFKRQLLVSYLISMLFYFITVGTTWFAARSLGVEISYEFLLAIVPLVLLAAFIPVSLNGLGITEAGYVIFFQLAGLSAESSLGIALLLRIRLLATAAIGGGIFVRMRTGENTKQTDRALQWEDITDDLP